MKKGLLLIASFIVLNNFLFGQYYENGQDPFSINWKKIETSHFQVIFSEDVISEGKLYAAYLEKIYNTGGKTLGFSPRKIPVIMHNQNVLSNGEVAWAPRRMNLYIIPPQTEESELYGKGLALHEFRHVVQIDKTNQSSTRFLYYLLGEQAIGAVIGWHIPRWFFEGDAVAYETGASYSGRGRIPDFTMKLNAQINEKGIYSYPKAQFGSYKDFVPDHYELGYQLISYSRLNYGAEIWDRTLNQVARCPIHPNAFSKGIKKVTGLPERKLYRLMMEDFRSDRPLYEPSNEKKGKREKDYVNYYSPYLLGSNILSYKTSYSRIPRIVISGMNKKDKVINKPGNIFNQTFSYNDSVLVWNEFKATRWENNNFSRIVLFDLSRNEKKYLTRKTRAYYSRISPDKTKILSVEVDVNMNWTLTLREAKKGSLIKSIDFNNGQPVQPSWSPDMKEVVFMEVGDLGKSLGILNLNTQEINWVLQNEYIDMSNPMHTGDALIIKGVYNGTSNYLKYDLNSKEWTALTNVKFGVGEASINKSDFVYANYTSNGFKLNRMDLSNLASQAIAKPSIFETKQTLLLAKEEQRVDLNDVDTTFEIQNYSRLKNLINIHSWAPLGVNFQNFEVGPGVTIMSQNALSTSTITGGYQYNLTDESHRYFAGFSYKGFYPIFDATFSKTYYNKSLKTEFTTYDEIKYSDISLYSSMTIPFILNKGKWLRKLQGTAGYELINRTFSPDNDTILNDLLVHSFNYQVYFYKMLTTSMRDLQSKWGLMLNLNYMHSPFHMEQVGQLASGELQLYLPGLLKNQGLRFYGAYQWKEYGDHSGYTDQVAYPYGYQNYTNTHMVSTHFNYQFPIWYPDLNIFQLAYIKRFRANIFYQYSAFNYKGTQFDLKSVGADLTANLNIFRFFAPFEMGVRYARRLTFDDDYYQFLIKINL